MLRVALLLFSLLGVGASSQRYKFAHAPISLTVESSPELEPTSRTLQTQESLESINTDISQKYGANYSQVFQGDTLYSPNKYVRYRGKDDVSLFASRVLVNEDTVYVGMNGYDAFSGAVVVYRVVNDTHWEETAVIHAPEGAFSNFGVSFDQDGSWLAVGANALDLFTGVVYLYRNLNGHWALYTTLSPDQALWLHHGFGSKIALKGNTLAVATAMNEVFIYELIDGEWSAQAPQVLMSPAPFAQFGHALALSEDILVVGAPNHTFSAGAVFIFQRQSTLNWTMVSVLDSVTGWNSRFGHSVSMYDHLIAVGAVGFVFDTFGSPGADTESNIGHVYLYERLSSGFLRRLDTTPQWALSQEIISPLGRASYFGGSIDLYNNSLIVGAHGFPYSEVNGSNMIGAAFIYSKTSANDAFRLQYALPSPAEERSNFGFAVGVHNGFAAVGAFGDEFLKGSIVLAAFKPTTSSSSSNTLNNIDEVLSTRSQWQLNYVIFALLGILAIVVAAVLAFCCKCCTAPVAAPMKKKKKEEEDSPFTVHSYTGYCEIDDATPPQYAPSVASSHVSFPGFSVPPLQSWYAPPPVDKKDPALAKKGAMYKGNQTMEFDDGLTIESADEGFIRRMFPYKVFGPRGYIEGQDVHDYNEQEIQQKIAMEDKLRSKDSNATSPSSAASLIPDENDDEVHQSPHIAIDQEAIRASSEEKARARFAMLKARTAEIRRSSVEDSFFTPTTAFAHQQHSVTKEEEKELYEP